MKDNSNHSLPTGNIQNARFVNRVVVFVMFFFSMLFFSEGMLGQNGVTITSTESPSPTSANPIPITIKFEDAVDNLTTADFNVVNGRALQNLVRSDVSFKYASEKKFYDFDVKANSLELISNFRRIGEYLKEKLSKSIVSIDFNGNDELFFLTLENGVFKQDSNGNLIKVINQSEFGTPLDLVINRNNGNIYVADSEKGKILIFQNLSGNTYSKSGEIGTGTNADSNNPRGATGLALDSSGNIYVADNFMGNAQGQDAIKIYSPNGIFLRKTGTYGSEEILDPFRIAVDKNNNIYLSESGGANGRVLVFDQNLNPIIKIEGGNQGTPGSLILDDYGYLYIIDYESDFNLTDLFNNPLEFIGNYETIRDGNYSINVFDTNSNYSYVTTFDDSRFNLPIDIALNSCERIFINNLELSGPGPSEFLGPYPTKINSNFEFKLIEFKRQDLFTAEVVPDAPGEVKVSLKDKDFFKCDPQPEGFFSIEYQPEQENQAPVANNDNYSTDQDVPLTVNAPGVLNNDSDDDVDDSLTADLQNPPLNGSVTFNSDGSFTYTPNTGFFGVDTFTYFANDGTINSEAATVTITVNKVVPPNTAPVANNDNYSTDQDMPLTVDAPGVLINDSDDDVDDSLTADLQNPPANGSVTLNSDGSFTYTPDTGFFGEDTFTYFANDGTINSDAATVTITVNEVVPPNTAPVANNDNYTTDQDVPLTVNAPGVLINDSDDDVDDSLTADLQNPPLNGSVTLNSDGSFTYTPDTGFFGEDTFTYFANDGTVNSNIATVTIYTTPAAPTFDCPDPNVVTILPLDENCDYDEPDYSTKITNPKYFIEEAFFVQTSSRTDNTLNIQIEVYDGQGGEYIGKCEFPVTLQDQIPADVKCLEDKLIPYTDSKSFRLEDYRELLTISDNCSSNFEIVQSPAPGTIITDNTTVNFGVIDENNNQSGCSFKIKFFKESDLQILNCPGDQFFQVDENCSYAIPEIASTINTNIEGATVTQNITAGFEVNGNLTLTITAKFEDQVDTCEVKLITTDAIFPTIEFPADQTEMVKQGEGFQLPNYILNAVYDDNCFIQELKQQPDVGTVIYETTEIILTVVDNYGNSTECTFNVNIVTENPDLQITCLEDQTENLDANCQFQLPDYTQQAQANFDAVITQSPLPGSFISSDTKITLTATGDSGQTSCSFNINVVDTTPPVVNCVGIINLRLDAGGTASLSPQDLDDTSFDACGSISRTLSKSDFSVADLGTNTVRLTVTDASGNSDFCDTTVNVLPYEENAIDFTCKESFILQLDNNGEAQLSSGDLYTGTAGNYQFSVDKTSFTCADKGSNTVTLYYSDGNTGGNCRVEVVVEDLLPPVVRTKDISITLDANGTASITPEMLDDGSIDNCGDIRLFLDNTDFTCSDLGENRVILSAQDGSSNSASATATVTVLGNCQEPPITPTGPGYIFIYPNPTDGPFSYFLPAGIVLEKVEVYDMQGKYITTTLFEEGTVQYKMDLSYLQIAVYVLKLYTNKEELILRVIVR